MEFSVQSPVSPGNDVFNIDVSGNTYVAGKVGIGTTTPDAPLNISSSGSPQLSITNTNTSLDDFTVDQNGDIYAAGLVGIGTPPATYPLSINGTIWCTEVKVCAIGTCDFVFDKNYNLMPLKDLENYLQINHHLPGIASAKEMESSDGIALGKLNSQLLQKVEELTLYILKQQKQIDQQAEQMTEINKKLAELMDKQK